MMVGSGYSNVDCLLYKDVDYKGEYIRLAKGGGKIQIYEIENNGNIIWHYKSIKADNNTRLSIFADMGGGNKKAIYMNHKANISDFNEYFNVTRSDLGGINGFRLDHAHWNIKLYIANVDATAEDSFRKEIGNDNTDVEQFNDLSDITIKTLDNTEKLNISVGTDTEADIILYTGENYTGSSKQLFIDTKFNPQHSYAQDTATEIVNATANTSRENANWIYKSMKVKDGIYIYIINYSGGGSTRKGVIIAKENIPDLNTFFFNIHKDSISKDLYMTNQWKHWPLQAKIKPILSEHVTPIMKRFYL
tara:strand:- start:32 stop:946 length:915 start_codon:yes stop_codon:yes gene_type:complete